PSVQASPVNLDIAAMAAAFNLMADYTLAGNQTNPVVPDWGDLGDLKIFHMGDTINWEGVVICLGDVDVVGGGAAKNIVGALLIQGTVAGNSNINGNVKVLYSSQMLQNLNMLSKYEITSWIDQ